MTAVIIDFETERRRRLKADPDFNRCYHALTAPAAARKIPEEVLVKWATMLARSDDQTLPQIVETIEREMDAVGFDFA